MYNKIFKDDENNNYVFETVDVWTTGVYIEVPVDRLPKKIKDIKKLGGSGVITEIDGETYFTSNTSGELFKKTFKKYYELPKFKIKNSEKLKGISKEVSFESGYELLKDSLGRELEFKFKYGDFSELYNINNYEFKEYCDLERVQNDKFKFLSLDLILNKDDFIVLKNELENISCYKELIDSIYKEMKIFDKFNIKFIFKIEKSKWEIESNFKKELDRLVIVEFLKLLDPIESKWLVKNKL